MPPKAVYRSRPEHYNEYQKSWSISHRAKINEYGRRRHRANREKAIALYGGKCECCYETTYEFLAIDHIRGGGTQERKSRFPNSQSFYLYLSKTYEPDKYRILCHNCNSAMGYYGYCPHKGSSVTRGRFTAVEEKNNGRRRKVSRLTRRRCG